MITLRADTSQLEAAARRLDAAPAAVEAGQQRELAAIAGSVALDASLYPPAPQGSAYVRTGRLGDGWTTDVGAMEASAVNSVPYAQWVMGEQQARWMSHWRTTTTIAAQWAPQATERLAARAVQDVEGAL